MGPQAGGNEIKPLLSETFSGTMETGPAAAASRKQIYTAFYLKGART